MLSLNADEIIIGTFTGLYEIKAQLEKMGLPAKINTGFIEMSVKAREAFVSDFGRESQALAGETAELGVYRGDFARRINAAFPHKKLYLLDTFEGFSANDLTENEKMGRSVGARHFANTSVDLVLSKMPHPENCVVVKGWFPQSARGLENVRFAFVNLDCDLYEPILAGLRFFYPKMTAGGVILIHEYFSPGYVGVRQAVLEFMAENALADYQKMPIGDNLSVAILKIPRST